MDNTATKQLTANFPLCFKNGHTIDTLAFWCVKCGQVAQDSQVLGQISRMVPDAVDIRASYSCSCGHTNTYRIRLKDDKSFTWLSDDVWYEQRPAQLSTLSQLRLWGSQTAYFIRLKWDCFWLHRRLRKFHRFINNS